jgi:hypothetical protein
LLQVAIRLGRIVQDLRESGSGLVTPIEVERFANGARILFRPKDSSYTSSKDESKAAMEADQAAAAAAATAKKTAPSKGGYSSPEMERRLEEEKKKTLASADDAKEAPSKRKRQKLEGGLEVIVEAQPYRRVRIRRCNMAPDTVVKEESEAVILKALTRGIQTLETDYKLLLLTAVDNMRPRQTQT